MFSPFWSLRRNCSVTHCAFLPLPGPPVLFFILLSSYLGLYSLSSCCLVLEQNHPPDDCSPCETAGVSFCCLPFFFLFVLLFLLLSLAYFPSVPLLLFLSQISLTWEGNDWLPASILTYRVVRTSPLCPWHLLLCGPTAEPRPKSSCTKLLQ